MCGLRGVGRYAWDGGFREMWFMGGGVVGMRRGI